jgi:spore germination protein YaaH
MRPAALTLVLSLVLSPVLSAVVLAPATARVPDGLEVTGWILQGSSSRLVARNADGLTTLSVAGVSITASGRGVAAPGRDHARLLRTAHRQGLAAELLVSNYSNRTGGFDPARLHRLLSSPGRIDRVSARLAGYVADQGWDGVNVDLERVRTADGDGLVAFVAALQDALPAERTVSVDVSAATSVRSYRDRGYRLAGLAREADVIDLMTYDLHGSWSGPGPIGALDWQRGALDALLSVVPPEQVQLGVAGYGYTWPRRGTGHSVTDRRARALVAADGATAHWRPRPGEWSARLSNGTRLWWSDGRSYAKRVGLAREYGVRGLAVWRLGSADTLR